MPNRAALRLSATLLFAGVVISFIAGFFHADNAPANDHAAAFADYAASAAWTAAHLGQFVGMALIVGGLVLTFYAIDLREGWPGWTTRFAAVTSLIALALYGILQAVDGVALKHAVDAWAAAPEGEKAARFAAAEAIHWLEWGVRSYFSYMLGLCLLLLGGTIVGTARIPVLIGALIVVTGLAYLAQGWIIGAEGFSAANTVPNLVGIVSTVLWSVWLLIYAWTMKPAE